jgi:transketolase
MYIRLSRGRDPVVYPEVPAGFTIGKAATLRKGKDLTIITCGSRVHFALGAADILAKKGISARIIDMHTLKPLDKAVVRKAARETGAILVVEEHNIVGGLGSAVAEVLVDEPRIHFQRHGIPDEFAPVGPPAALYAHYQLDAEGIARKARAFLAAKRRI